MSFIYHFDIPWFFHTHMKPNLSTCKQCICLTQCSTLWALRCIKHDLINKINSLATDLSEQIVNLINHHWFSVKKAIPVTGCGGLQGCEMLRIPNCLDNQLIDGGKTVSPHAPVALYSPGTLFFLMFRVLISRESKHTLV
jgi:hypothetical protein